MIKVARQDTMLATKSTVVHIPKYLNPHIINIMLPHLPCNPTFLLFPFLLSPPNFTIKQAQSTEN